MITPQNPFIFRGLFILYIEGFLLLHGISGADTDGVFVMVGDLVTLHIGAKKNKQSIKWYFNDTCVAQMKSELKICADDQCHDDKERFRDRLELDSQTGSLTITNIRITDSGVYKLQINSSSEKTFSVSVRDVPAAQRDEMKSVKEGESVTLCPGVIKNKNDSVTWYFNDIGITKITGGSSNVCTDEQCTHQYSELRNRLVVNNQTGSLTIMNTRTTDAGLYHLEISSSSNNITIRSIKTFSVTVIGASGVETDGVSLSVMEGDSVTLQTGIKITQDDTINWYFNDFLIAQINRDLKKSFKYYMRFRDRLKLDIQTGSLTIMNITITDAGLCILEIINSRISEKIFRVSVREAEKMKTTPVKEGESITLDPGEINTNVLMTWYFNDSCIAEISGDPNKMCTDDQCEDSDGRFRDRLKLDHQTGSLTITNTRTTDSGVYKLEINSSGSSIHRRLSSYKSFSVAVIDSGQSEVEIYAGVFSAVAAAMTVGVICCRRNNSTLRGHNEHHVEDFSPNMAEIQLMTVESSPNQTETASATST